MSKAKQLGDRSLTAHRSLRTVHHSPLTAHRSLLTAHYSPLTTHRSLLTAHRSSLTAHRSPLTAHRSPLTTHRSPLTAPQCYCRMSTLTATQPCPSAPQNCNPPDRILPLLNLARTAHPAVQSPPYHANSLLLTDQSFSAPPKSVCCLLPAAWSQS